MGHTTLVFPILLVTIQDITRHFYALDGTITIHYITDHSLV